MLKRPSAVQNEDGPTPQGLLYFPVAARSAVVDPLRNSSFRAGCRATTPSSELVRDAPSSEVPRASAAAWVIAALAVPYSVAVSGIIFSGPLLPFVTVGAAPVMFSSIVWAFRPHGRAAAGRLSGRLLRPIVSLLMFVNIGVEFVKRFAALAARPGIGDEVHPRLARRAAGGLPFGIAAFTLAVVLGVAGAARAENECGRPEAGTPIVCSPSSYDAATDGNIVYRPSAASEGDFTIRLTDDLSIRYDRHDPDDDVLVVPVDEDRLYSAVRIETDADHAGDLSLFSSADVTSNGRGVSVSHYGKSGGVRTEISGGTFSIASEWPSAFAIHSFRGDGYGTNEEVTGDLDLIVRDVVVDLEGAQAGIFGFQGGEGHLNVAVHDSAIEVDADLATAVYGTHRGTGDFGIEVEDTDIAIRGSGGVDGIYGSHHGTGDTDITVRSVNIEVHGDDSDRAQVGIFGFQGGEGYLNVAVHDTAIEVDADLATGVYGSHHGTGDVDLEVQDVDIEVRGSGGVDAIYGYHRGTGDTEIAVRNADIEVHGGDSDRAQVGIFGFQGGEGYLNVAVHDTAINVDAELGTGVFGSHGSVGDVDIEVQNADIEVRGSGGVDGVYGYHLGTGDADIAVRNVDIEVHGDEGSNGISYTYWKTDGAGNLTIDARDVGIEVHGERHLDGIFGMHRGTGDIDVDVRRGTFVTNGADSGAIAFVHDGEGGIDIAARDVDIEVHGDRSAGIGGGQRHAGTGDITIDVRDSTVAVTGESVAGIRSFHMSGEGGIEVRVDGGTIVAEGPGSSGILVGLTGRIFGERTGPIKAPAGGEIEVDENAPGVGSGADGFRAHRVVVDGRVRGGSGVGAGVRLYGGGQVEIGPRGSVGASSGVAVRAEGEGAALRVGVALDGRRPGQAIAGALRNDEGRTTVAVNGVVLHDAMTGATGVWAPNGARDVSLTSSETVAGRVFMPTDFVTGPYAPRAAVYEALPGFMLRLDDRGTAGRQLRGPGSPAWVRVSGGQGSYGPERASVGADYELDRFEAEAGVDFALSREENLTGWTSLRHVRGSADVSAPTGGGKIESVGFGASFGATWTNAAGYRASGRVSVTRYETDLTADGRGLLKEDAGATVRTLGVEAGRRFSFADDLSIVPQAWLTRSDVSMDGFRDAVGSRVSLRESARSIVGLGVVTETAHSWDGGERKLGLSGRLGVERVLGDAETVADVSGERLGSETRQIRAVLGARAAYHGNRWSLGAEVSASGLGSDESDYTVSLRLRTQF